jgi:phage repressor protein C with HTH and peptisase S24 domain
MSSPINIKNIRQLYNLTQEEFALALGITRELVNKMEKGKSGVSKATRLLIQKFLEERKSEENSHEMTFLGIPSQREVRRADPMPYFQERRDQKQTPKMVLVPLVGIKAQAGYIKGYEHVDYMDTLEKYSLPPGVNGAGAVWSYFEVDGDSMEPTFSPSDMILASMLPQEDWNDIKNNCVYIILTNDQLIVKRVQKIDQSTWKLISDNSAYPQVEITTETIKQVWTFRRHITAKI